MPAREQVVFGLGKTELIAIASTHGFNITKSLKLEEYRETLAQKLVEKAVNNADKNDTERDENVDPEELVLVTEILRSSFMKPKKDGNGERQSKYTIR